ncbi:pilus assembly protein [Rhodobacteraceae bacterium LMO-12]|jgi:Flp pilus assembly protein TadG|nr:pilus assembly protein [Rhodobacteraceae bacterium LMO-JJ12]
MLKTFKMRLAAFRDDCEGVVAVEAVMIFPMVMWAFMAMFVFFEGYRQTSISHKAANTIADMLSRETADITETYIDNTKDLFDLLAQATNDTKIRVSVVKWADRHDSFRVEWSKTRGSGITNLSNDDMVEMESKLPTVPNQERMVLVETWSTFEPSLKVGLDDQEIKTFVFTRLRFAPQLKFP